MPGKGKKSLDLTTSSSPLLPLPLPFLLSFSSTFSVFPAATLSIHPTSSFHQPSPLPFLLAVRRTEERGYYILGSLHQPVIPTPLLGSTDWSPPRPRIGSSQFLWASCSTHQHAAALAYFLSCQRIWKRLTYRQRGLCSPLAPWTRSTRLTRRRLHPHPPRQRSPKRTS